MPSIPIDSDINEGNLSFTAEGGEHFLFHGTSPGALDAVATDFNEAFSDGVFGKGLYLAENRK